MTDDELKAYIDSLEPGEEVIETCQTSCMRGLKGRVYISDRPGQSYGTKCVRWDNEDGTFMGTSVTGGTRRVSEVCTCGNPEMGFECMCEWMKNHPGNINYSCEWCGIYSANEPRCNKCEVFED